jgi:hypothetical protein
MLLFPGLMPPISKEREPFLGFTQLPSWNNSNSVLVWAEGWGEEEIPPGTVGHICNPSTQEAEQEELKKKKKIQPYLRDLNKIRRGKTFSYPSLSQSPLCLSPRGPSEHYSKSSIQPKLSFSRWRNWDLKKKKMDLSKNPRLTGVWVLIQNNYWHYSSHPLPTTDPMVVCVNFSVWSS